MKSIDVPCPRCNAPEGRRCRTAALPGDARGPIPVSGYHAERVAAAAAKGATDADVVTLAKSRGELLAKQRRALTHLHEQMQLLGTYTHAEIAEMQRQELVAAKADVIRLRAHLSDMIELGKRHRGGFPADHWSVVERAMAEARRW